MEKLINYVSLRSFAYSNDRLCIKPIKGIVLHFPGLGTSDMYFDDTDDGKYFAQLGIIYIIPYYNPWAWMNRQTVAFVDEILDVIFNEYSLDSELPVISSGLSMGGLSALVYTHYAKRTPVACVANCPVCDLPYHFTERADLPRTLYSAFGGYEGSFDKALESASPYHLAEEMPSKTAYYIFHCEKDSAVSIEKHSKKFVEKLSKGHRVKFLTVPDRDHCDLTEEMRLKYNECIISSIILH